MQTKEKSLQQAEKRWKWVHTLSKWIWAQGEGLFFQEQWLESCWSGAFSHRCFPNLDADDVGPAAPGGRYLPQWNSISQHEGGDRSSGLATSYALFAGEE